MEKLKPLFGALLLSVCFSILPSLQVELTPGLLIWLTIHINFITSFKAVVTVSLSRPSLNDIFISFKILSSHIIKNISLLTKIISILFKKKHECEI